MHQRASFPLHRNSQKRLYQEDAIYFLTCVTQNREPYFKEKILCEVFLENLRICQRLKGFELYGYFLGYDHFHMMIKPCSEVNYSEIMRSLKTNTSCDINRIMDPNVEGAVPSPRLHEIYRHRPHFFNWKNQFLKKHPNPQKIPFPIFRWQKSFHDHVIRDERDFLNHLNYIRGNPLKHNMPKDWPYMWIDQKWEKIDPP